MKGNKDLTTGKLGKKMFVFSVPLIITNLMQALYNIIDMIIIGKYAGASGLAAVGNGGQVTVVVLCIVIGISNAGAVMVAHLAGQKRSEEISNLMGTMLVTFVVLALVLTALVMLFTNPILRVLDTPAEAWHSTVIYLRICIMGTICVYLYNFLMAVLRGLGNSKVPMIIIFITTCVNIVLDLIFVGACSMGTAGAAIATVIAQALNMVLIIYAVHRNTVYLDDRKKLMHISAGYLKTLLKIGLPQSVQFTLTNLSYLFIIGMVNTYGVYASAAAGSSAKLSSFAVLSAQAVMGAVITMTGQNLAAGNYDRVMQGMRWGILYALPLPLVFFCICVLRPERMLGLFTDEMEVLMVGGPYLRIIAVSFLIEAVMFCLMGLLTGAGYTNVTMLCAIISSFGIRFGLAKLFSTGLGMGFLGVAWAYPFAPVSSLLICFFFILSGRWRNSRVEMSG